MTHVRARLELAESDPVGEVIDLDAEQATALGGSGLVSVSPYGAGTWKVVPVLNKVGAVRIDSWELVVRPKAPFASVLFMLAYAHDPGIAPEEFEGSEDADLWPMVAATLERLVGRALAEGVLQGYAERDDSLTVVRGRILVTDQLARHQGRPLPLEVRYDDYAIDIPENQILRAALHRMARVPGLPPDLRGGLAHLEARVFGARLLRAGEAVPAWRVSRLNRRYAPALRLAELVLHHVGLSTEHGSRPVASFVVNMAQAFERFVTVAVTEAYAPHDRASAARSGSVIAQFQTHLDVEHTQPIRPDIVHVDTVGRPDAVFDAKYKLIDTERGGGPRLPDLYQMLAYCTVLGLDRGTLIYAADHTLTATPGLDVVGGNARIAIAPFAIDRPPAQLLRAAEELIGMQ